METSINYLLGMEQVNIVSSKELLALPKYLSPDGMGRGKGGARGVRMGNTCKSMADSCQCMAKTTTIL